MSFKLEFETDNAAFSEENFAQEVADILTAVSRKVASGRMDGIIKDSNGNTVGSFVADVDFSDAPKP